ncbi:hypothetical protein TWF694_007947 [Orbilia ellipsospora]|uniref:Uncharacterized protein n=1 Tax=Orbilia ellipsospora TaxID=2528407 RepID=A0AAV9XJ82_9PEZI
MEEYEKSHVVDGTLPVTRRIQACCLPRIDGPDRLNGARPGTAHECRHYQQPGKCGEIASIVRRRPDSFDHVFFAVGSRRTETGLGDGRCAGGLWLVRELCVVDVVGLIQPHIVHRHAEAPPRLAAFP